MPYEAVPVTIRGITYKSQWAAAKALGVTQHTIHRALERGTLDNIGLGRNYSRLHPVTINNISYKSITEAAKALGISRTSLSARIHKGKV